MSSIRRWYRRLAVRVIQLCWARAPIPTHQAGFSASNGRSLTPRTRKTSALPPFRRGVQMPIPFVETLVVVRVYKFARKRETLRPSRRAMVASAIATSGEGPKEDLSLTLSYLPSKGGRTTAGSCTQFEADDQRVRAGTWRAVRQRAEDQCQFSTTGPTGC